MNIRIVTLSLVFAVAPALAQESSAKAEAAASERAAMLKSLQRGKAIKGSRGQYRVLPEVQAVEHGAAGASGSQIIGTQGRLVLFRSAQQKPAIVERRGGAGVYPAVVNVRTGTLGVLTGTLVVKPKNMADADAIASGFALEKTKAYAHLGTVFYQARDNVDIADVSAALQADPRVESAYPEIIEQVRVPR